MTIAPGPPGIVAAANISPDRKSTRPIRAYSEGPGAGVEEHHRQRHPGDERRAVVRVEEKERRHQEEPPSGADERPEGADDQAQAYQSY